MYTVCGARCKIDKNKYSSEFFQILKENVVLENVVLEKCSRSRLTLEVIEENEKSDWLTDRPTERQIDR